MNRQKHSQRLTDNILYSSLTVLASLVLLSAVIREPMGLFDEGFADYGALRVMNGQVPYRDFWMIYPPGQFYLLAGLFRAFGANVLVARVYDIVVHLALSLAVYLIVARLSSPRAAVIPSLVVTLSFTAIGFYDYAGWPALLFGLLGAIATIKYFDNPRPFSILLAGLLAGVAVLFRHDLGGYLIVCLITAVTLFSLRQSSSRGLGFRQKVLDVTRLDGWFLLGALAPVLPALAFLLAVVPFSELWSDLIVNPVTLSVPFYLLPLPPIFPNPFLVLSGVVSPQFYSSFILDEWVPFYSPLIIFVIAANTLRKIRQRPDKHFAVVLLVLIGLALTFQAIRRNDDLHQIPMFVVGIILLTFLITEHQGNWSRRQAVLIIPALLLLSIPYIVRPAQAWITKVTSYPPLACLSALPRSSCVATGKEQEKAIQFIRDHVSEEELIFVGNSRHDRIFTNDVMFYFLSERASATKYHQLERSLVPTLPVQKEIIKSLDSRQVRYIVLVSTWDDRTEPNESGNSSGVRMLDQYIADKFSQVAQFGDYTIKERN